MLDKVFNLKSKDSENVQTSEKDALKAIKNWYSERYETIIVQRNILFILLIFSLVGIIVSIFAMSQIANSKTFEPFVVQIDGETGRAEVVNPVESRNLTANESLNRFMIKRYITARETYNPVSFDNIARQTIRVLSSGRVYREYLSYIRNEANDPLIKYGQNNTTFIQVKSWSRINGGDKYLVRFSITETAREQKVFNKIAVVSFEYVAMELTDEERDINPVGFQVTGYEVNDDKS